MRRSRTSVLLGGLVGLFAPASASGQTSIHLGGGATFPMGDYGNYASTGWMAHGGVALPLGDAGLAVGATGYFGANGHRPPPGGDRTSLYGALGFVQVALGNPEAASPVLFGGAGLMVHDYRSETQPGLEGSNTGFAAGAGAGVRFPVGGIGAFAGAWLLNGFFDAGDTTIAGVTAGLELAVGAGR